MSWSVALCLQELLNEINAQALDRDKSSDGSIGDPAHASRPSDHNPDKRGIVHARDFTHDPDSGADMNALAEEVKDDPRVKYVIWNRRIWSPSVTKSWRRYTGSNPHTHHMHVSVLSGERFENDVSPWLKEDDLTPDQAKKLEEVWNALYEKKGGKFIEHLDLLEKKLDEVLSKLSGR